MVPISGHGGTYTHAKTGAAMVVYVDDMMLLASPTDEDHLWRELEKSVLYKDPAAPLQRYLGALYKFDCFDQKTSKKPGSMQTSMDDCAGKSSAALQD